MAFFQTFFKEELKNEINMIEFNQNLENFYELWKTLAIIKKKKKEKRNPELEAFKIFFK